MSKVAAGLSLLLTSACLVGPSEDDHLQGRWALIAVDGAPPPGVVRTVGSCRQLAWSGELTLTGAIPESYVPHYSVSVRGFEHCGQFLWVSQRMIFFVQTMGEWRARGDAVELLPDPRYAWRRVRVDARGAQPVVTLDQADGHSYTFRRVRGPQGIAEKGWVCVDTVDDAGDPIWVLMWFKAPDGIASYRAGGWDDPACADGPPGEYEIYYYLPAELRPVPGQPWPVVTQVERNNTTHLVLSFMRIPQG